MCFLPIRDCLPFNSQMLQREKVSKFCDVYSYGVLLFEIATQQLPFPDVLPLLVPSMTMEGKVGNSEGTNHFRECPYFLVRMYSSLGVSNALFAGLCALNAFNLYIGMPL